MNIAIFLPTLCGGGAEAVARKWARGLAVRGHAVTFLTYLPSPAALCDGFSVISFPGSTRVRRWFRLRRWLRLSVRDGQYDLVLSLLTFPNIILLSSLSRRRSGARLVISERTVPSILLRTEGLSGRVRLLLAKRLYRRADSVIAVSHPVAADLFGSFHICAQRLWVIPNPALDAPDSHRHAHNCGVAQPIRILYVGRLVRQKQPERILDTLQELQKRGFRPEAVFVGDGPRRSALEAAAMSCGAQVEFAGWTDAWQLIAKDCSCLLLPSDVEGFGNVLVEAAGIGLPVVAPSQALGIGDAIIPNVTGIPALSPRPSDLADAVLAAVSLSDRDQHASNWRLWYSTDNSIDRLETALRHTMAEDQ